MSEAVPFDTDRPWPTPDIAQAAFVDPSAVVIGHVILAAGSSLWPTAVLRGDIEAIQIGAYTNVQDGAVIHCDRAQPVILEDFVTVGHRAVIHSAHVERGCLIGIGAIILNGVRIGAGSIIGAGAVVTKAVPPRSLVMGIPGKVVKPISEEQAQGLLDHAQEYFHLAQLHRHKQTAI
ncbi:gamma carbonic anhydrase family protein [filamentous cyanobacterium CCP5]|nr:gamma carbonic anhydrase family protein [filamentous cyanobacterium CCP5]